MSHHNPEPYETKWPTPDRWLLTNARPKPPTLPLEQIVPEKLAEHIRLVAKQKSAPPDYIFASLLCAAGSLLGNARWVSPWHGWSEPPIIWTMLIGLPSSGKSPATDAVLGPLYQIQRPFQNKGEERLQEWSKQNELAKIAEKAWKAEVRQALKTDGEAPERPSMCDVGRRPHIPKFVINDATIEKVACIMAEQPRGVILFRDEIAAWLLGMERYSNSSDRPFWLEAYGGRAYSVERMSREPIRIDNLSIGIFGGIQPDRLKTLLFETDDDGLLARFIPIWPERVPLEMPPKIQVSNLIESTLQKIANIKPSFSDPNNFEVATVMFDDQAAERLQALRKQNADREKSAEGLFLSFLGKLPGLTARIALILTFIEWACEEKLEPSEVKPETLAKAVCLVEKYIIPMAQRAYADASTPKTEQAARRLLTIIQEHAYQQFSARDIQRLGRKGLRTKQEIAPALKLLEEEGFICLIAQPDERRLGRPSVSYAVNPKFSDGFQSE